MRKIDGMMSNDLAKTLLAKNSKTECCYYCMNYAEDPETGEAVCRKHDMQTVCIAMCNGWERKGDGCES